MAFWDLVQIKLKELESPRFDPSLSGAHVLRAEKISAGFNLFDGQIIDLAGKFLKKWNSHYLSILLPDGKYLAQKSYGASQWGLYTWDDQAIWEKNLPIHHDIFLTTANTIITLTKETHPYKGRKVDFCVVVEFDLHGQELMRWSTWDDLAYLQTFHSPLELDRPKIFFLPEPGHRKPSTSWGGNYDYYRLNSFQLLPQNPLEKQDRRFQKGNWLISFRHGSMVFIIDKDTKKIVWKCIANDIAGSFEGQHAPTMLTDGRILVFDNGRYRGFSRVIEIDPLTLKIFWQYRAPGFYTHSQGYAQRLANGNTLITESERGHVFEITREKEIVWEYFHPDKQDASNSLHPESFGKRQWIYRMVRYESLLPFASK